MKLLNTVLDWFLDREPWQIMIVLAISCCVLGVAIVDYHQSVYGYIPVPR